MTPVPFLAGLRRAWISIEVPGTSFVPLAATYVEYPSDGLPPGPDNLGSWEWLRGAESHPDSHMAAGFESASRDLSARAIADLANLPADFQHFVAEPDLRSRTRSATDSYFDLADHVQEVEGGYLLHFLSDSQWVMHWLLYVGDDGTNCVLATPFPVGFNLGEDDLEAWQDEPWEYVVVADSFAEFMWRWWMDNEVFYAVVVDKSASEAIDDYVRQYATPRSLGSN